MSACVRVYIGCSSGPVGVGSTKRKEKEAKRKEKLINSLALAFGFGRGFLALHRRCIYVASTEVEVV